MSTTFKPAHVAATLTAAVVVALGVIACGSSGAGAGGPAPEAALIPGASQSTLTVRLMASSTVLASDGTRPIDLQATVVDENGRAMADQTVDFRVSDPGKGTRLEVADAGKTDVSGLATARLQLNGNPEVRSLRVTATVGQQAPAEILLDVKAPSAADSGSANNSRGELMVRLGTNNLIEESADKLSYIKKYVVIVSDNAGVPKSGVSVSAVVRPHEYYVGYWAPTKTGWVAQRLALAGSGIARSMLANPSEDSERSGQFGFCDPGEDVNGDSVLTPGNVVSYRMLSATDIDGTAVLQIVYPKSSAEWTNVRIEATAKVGGTEAFNAVKVGLPMMAADVKSLETAPPSFSRTMNSLLTDRQKAQGLRLRDEEGSIVDTDSEDEVPGSPYPYYAVNATCTR